MTGTDRVIQRALKLLEPDEDLSPVEWCERNLVLTRGVTSRPGRFKAWPWQRDPLNICQTHSSCVLMFPAQLLGKTVIATGIMGYVICVKPCAMLMLFPSIEMAEIYSKTKLTPLLMDTPALGKLVHEDALKLRRKGAGDTTVLLKRFPGGYALISGATAATALRSHSTKYQFMDEISVYPPTIAGGEGDPIAIATKRSETFPDSFQMLTSTPTIAGECRVTLAYGESDQRKWFIRCENCGHEFVIMWSHIVWDKEIGPDGKKIHRTETARLACPCCHAEHSDEARQRMAMAGRWVITRPEEKTRAGFWANAFICCLPAKKQGQPGGFKNRLHQWADEFIQAKRLGTMFMRAFQMTTLTEAYQIDDAPAPPYQGLYDRREAYREHAGGVIIPRGGMVLTIGADLQPDRLEATLTATGMDGEVWFIAHEIFYGEPEKPQIWHDFDQFCKKGYRHEQGTWLQAQAVCIDSAFKGFFVYKHIKSCRGRRVFAVRGDRGFAPLGSNWVDRSQSDNERLWIIKVDGVKESLYSRLRLEEPGPGYLHFPSNPQCKFGLEYFRQLTVEVIKTAPSGQKFYAKPHHDSRNEATDCFVYSAAGVAILDPNWAMVKASLEAKPQNDWRTQEEARTQMISLPIPDLRETEANMDALRSKVMEGAKRWCKIR